MAYDQEADVPEQDDLFNVDNYGGKGEKPKAEPEPLYRIYKGSKIPVSKSVGTMWKKRYDAAIAAYDSVFLAWDECFRYYNNNNTKDLRTPRGVFKRGDSSENIVYSNLNVMLPAVYGQDPDIAVNSIDEGDEDFMGVLKSLLNVLFSSKQKLNAKPRIKRAVGLALLTNFGILKIDYTRKEDSLELALENMSQLTQRLTECKDAKEAEAVYGEIEALENTLEVYEKNGPRLSNVLPHNLIIDAYAEDNDAMDSKWMIERIFLPTDALIAQYTQPSEGEDEYDKSRTLVYKPTHKASFAAAGVDGRRDDGLGLVLTALSEDVTGHEDEERKAFRGMYYSECFMVWDKTTRRVYLYARDDWTWPIWVWDDPLKISRFFPYFIISYGMSTGGTVSVGETAYYLDQQDEINDINRQVAKIRRTLFDYFFYNSDKVDKDEVEKFVKAVRGVGEPDTHHILGVRAGDGKLADLIEPFTPPQLGQNFEPFFNKEPILNSINRISNTSDALRGTQFKTNTNEAAIQSYQDAARMAVGAKVDVVEDTISDLAQALAELCVQFMDETDVAGIVGQKQAQKWQQMDMTTFTANYTFECVAGTTEKPNSTYKKKEAVQIAQAMGQFSSAAPITSMKIMLRVLQNAFSEINVTPDDWEQLNQEASMALMKGNSMGGGAAPAPGQNAPPGGAPQGQPPAGGPPQGAPGGDIKAQMMNLPPETKQKAVQMKQQGVPDGNIANFLMGQVQGGPNGAASPPKQKVAQISPQAQQAGA